MSATKHPRMTADQFIAWAMEQPKGARYELEDGEVVVDMAPERVAHAVTKARIWRRLEDAIFEARLPCEALPDGLVVVVDHKTVYEPDALVRCGAPLPGDEVRVPDPMVIVEVASPSTSWKDAGPKLADYFRIPSLRHYLLVSPAKKLVIHHERGVGGVIVTRIIHDGSVRLDPPGITLDRFWPEGPTA